MTEHLMMTSQMNLIILLLGMGNGIICSRMTRFLKLPSKTFLCGNKIFLLMFLMNNQDIMIYPWQP